jgi:glucose-1-phosphate cytidylyltransferase
MKSGNSLMKAVILAGGYGARLSEETERHPKPMVEISGRTVLAHHEDIFLLGFDDFIVLTGYKSPVIRNEKILY